MEKKIIFAGTEMLEFSGHLEGALQSDERVVFEIVIPMVKV